MLILTLWGDTRQLTQKEPNNNLQKTLTEPAHLVLFESDTTASVNFEPLLWYNNPSGMLIAHSVLHKEH